MSHPERPKKLEFEIEHDLQKLNLKQRYGVPGGTRQEEKILWGGPVQKGEPKVGDNF